MENIIKRIEHKIDLMISNAALVNFNTKSILLGLLETLEKLKKPDDFKSFSVLNHAIFSQSFVSKMEYVIKLAGFYESHPNESQIIKAKGYLEDVRREIRRIHYEGISLSNKLYFKCLNDIEYLNNLLMKLKDYDSNMYIEENEFDIICGLFENDDIDDEILNEIKTIGINNSLIKIREKNTEEIISKINFDEDNELFEKMDSDRKSIDIVNAFYSKINNYADNPKLLKMLLKDDNILTHVMAMLSKTISIRDKVNKNTVELATLYKEEFDSSLDDEEIICSVAYALMEAIEANDLEKIDNILDRYKKIEEEKVSINKNLNIALVLLDKINSIKEDFYNEDEYLNFKSSYRDLSEEEIIQIIGIKTYSKFAIMKLFYDNEFKIKEQNIEFLEELLQQLSLQIEIYNSFDSLVEEETEKEDMISEGLDIYDTKNYPLILNQERLHKNIEEIMNEHKEVNLTLFSKIIEKLLLIPHEELYKRDSCKPIMLNVNISNPYDIREERAGVIRIGFKAINTKDGFVAYEILSFAYGACDGKSKSDNLKSAIKEYENNMDEYKKLEEQIKNSTLEECTKVFTDGLTFYNSLIIEAKKGLGEV